MNSATFSTAGLTFDQKMFRLARYLREDVHVPAALDEMLKMNLTMATVHHLDIKDLVEKFASIEPQATSLLRKIELLEKRESMMAKLVHKEKTRKRFNEASIPEFQHRRTASTVTAPKLLQRIPLKPVQGSRIPKSEPVKKTKSMNQEKFLEMLIAKNRQKVELKKEETMKRSAKMILTEPLPVAPPPAKKGRY